MSALRDERGAIALTTVLLLPLLTLVLTGLLELGAIRLVSLRARAAADLATLVAVNDQDDETLARNGTLRLARDAEEVARAYFAANLEPLAAALALAPQSIAAAAEVVVLERPGGVDPRTNRRFEHPTVRLFAEVPVRTPAFRAFLLPPVTTVNVLAASSAR